MSEIRANTISDTAGTGPITLTKQSAAKAWTLYNQATPAITNSFNTSSLTDTSLGQGDLNWTNAMSNNSYVSVATAPVASVATPYSTAVMDDSGQSDYRTASKWYFQCVYTDASSSGYFDGTVQSASIFGDLA